MGLVFHGNDLNQTNLYVLDSSTVVEGVSTVFLPISCWVQGKNSWTRSLTGRLRPYHLVLATSKFTKSSTFPRQPVRVDEFAVASDIFHLYLGLVNLLRCEMHSQRSNIQQFQKGQTKTPSTQNSPTISPTSYQTSHIKLQIPSIFLFHQLLHFPINPFAPRMINQWDEWELK